ncbi:hypothetical protein [Lacimicrobium alkaliphilum]|uniref:PEP-CTERM protein-sorting domain-containing protein n=1 Tax=Lacimicrobium alkaliphilum TaxID=1526571 RepID=A0ABQ1RJB2_9ALTE|nr:hypothetical protein [Lacimicrobium alkaliphilum]GGD70059.1 hypothetical protein GCM10011357_26340 [Lacimicrobium alkaliphilum]
MLLRLTAMFFCMLPTLSHAIIIELDLNSDTYYQFTERDESSTIINQEYVNVTSENFVSNLEIDLGSATGPVVQSIDAGPYVQHTTRTDYHNYSFDIFSPFLSVFSPFISDDISDDVGALTPSSSYLDYSVFFNETIDPNYFGGNASIRFGQNLYYETFDSLTGTHYRESLWMSGRLFLTKIENKGEYDTYSQLSLNEVLGYINGSFIRWSASVSNFQYCDTSCQEPFLDQNYLGNSYGNSTLVQVSEPSSIFISLITLLGFVTIRRRLS